MVSLSKMLENVKHVRNMKKVNIITMEASTDYILHDLITVFPLLMLTYVKPLLHVI